MASCHIRPLSISPALTLPVILPRIAQAAAAADTTPLTVTSRLTPVRIAGTRRRGSSE